MSQYKYTPAQLRYLSRMHAANKELERACDCAGCDKCTGFVNGCHCDDKTEDLRAIRGMGTTDTDDTHNVSATLLDGEYPF